MRCSSCHHESLFNHECDCQCLWGASSLLLLLLLLLLLCC
jgi:hypothetical protein